MNERTLGSWLSEQPALPIEDEIVPCEYETWAGSVFEPPEYCEEDSVRGEVYCVRHLAMEEGE